MALVMYKEKGLFSERSWSWGTSGVGFTAYGDSIVSRGKTGQASQYMFVCLFVFSSLFGLYVLFCF